jgi:hypothetical protein
MDDHQCRARRCPARLGFARRCGALQSTGFDGHTAGRCTAPPCVASPGVAQHRFLQGRPPGKTSIASRPWLSAPSCGIQSDRNAGARQRFAAGILPNAAATSRKGQRTGRVRWGLSAMECCPKKPSPSGDGVVTAADVASPGIAWRGQAEQCGADHSTGFDDDAARPGGARQFAAWPGDARHSTGFYRGGQKS